MQPQKTPERKKNKTLAQLTLLCYDLQERKKERMF